MKRAVNSKGGFGVDFLKGENLSFDLRKLMKTIPCDVVVQHSQMAALHTELVNTLRLFPF